MTRSLFLTGLAGVAALGLVVPPALAQGGPLSRQAEPGVLIAPYTPSPFPVAIPPHSAEDVLPPEDEMAFTRALLLMRAGRMDESGVELERLGEQYPWSRRVAALRATIWTRRGDPKRALRVLDESARAQKEEFGDREQGFEIERFAPERAAAYLALQDRARALPWMLEAVDRRGAASQDLHEKLLEWALDEKWSGRVERQAAQLYEASPQRVPTALLAAEMAAVAGRWESGWQILDRTEQLVYGGVRGDLHRSLARRLSAWLLLPARVDARAWLELARRAPREEARFEAFRVLLDARALPAKEAGMARAMALPSRDLVTAWEGLPSGSEREIYGLQLSTLLRQRGARDEADQVADALREENLPPDLQGAVSLEQGLARLRSGDLEGARARIEEAAAQATGTETRMRSLYALAEARYFSKDFEGAHTAFSDFVRFYPKETETNDALERLYLLEGGGTPTGAVVTGSLEELAEADYAVARGDWEAVRRHAEAARTAATATEENARVQAHFLLSRALEQQGRSDDAVAAVLWVADSLSEHRRAPLARRRAADLLLAAGRTPEALAQYEELLARHPDSWVAPEVRRRVMSLRAGSAQ